MPRVPRIALLAVGLAALVAWIAFDLRDDHQGAEPRADRARGPSARQATEGAGGSLPVMLTRAELPALGADPFALPAAPRSKATSARPPAPVAPPFPYRYAGQLKQDGTRQVFLASGERVFPVVRGETLDGQYVVESVSEDTVTVAHLPTKTQYRIQFDVAAKDPDLPAATVVPAAAAPGTAAGRDAKLVWDGPVNAKLGTSFRVALRLTSKTGIRAAPMQLQFDPKILEPIDVEAGDFFGEPAGADFDYKVDPAGSIRVGMSGRAPTPVEDAEILVLTFKPINGEGIAEVGVASLTLQNEDGMVVKHRGVPPFRTKVTR